MPPQVGAFGWIYDANNIAKVKGMLPIPNVQDVIKDIRPKARPSSVYLWKIAEKVTGTKLGGWNQKQVGSCVGFGSTKALAHRSCVEIAVLGDMEKYVELAPEITYAGSRQVAGISGSSDGSFGSAAAEFLNKYGGGKRGKYGKYDLTQYTESNCRDLGRRDLPNDILEECKQHSVKTVSQVTRWDDAKDVLAKGGCILICSNRGFNSMKRDSYGRVKPSGSWPHCMCLCGYHEETNLDMGFIDNSWGDNAMSGPIGPGDGPLSGFYADGNVIEKDILKIGDCWALYDYEGHKADYVIDYLY